jgi:hypothetical protein
MYNINPLIWGPHLWKFMHYLTLAYPDEPSDDDKQKFKTFFLMIGDYLPCEKCRVHYKEHLKITPLTDEILSSRDGLIKWLFNLHNIVNESNGKPKITYDDFLDIYVNNTIDSNKEDNKIYKYGLLTILVIILLILFVVYKKCLR